MIRPEVHCILSRSLAVCSRCTIVALWLKMQVLDVYEYYDNIATVNVKPFMAVSDRSK